MADYSTLCAQLPASIECFVLDSVDSTNDYLSQITPSTNPQVCVASEQTSGRGQYERAWVSSKDSSVILSIRRRFPTHRALNGLSLVVGLSIVKVLDSIGVGQAQLKWPNDVYVGGQKLSGVLIENTVQSQSQYPVIGIGLNNQLSGDDIATPWTDLTQLLGAPQELSALSASIIKQVLSDCERFEQQGFEAFQADYQDKDYLFGKQLSVQYQDQQTIGQASGIHEDGALLIDSDNATLKVYSSEQIQLI